MLPADRYAALRIPDRLRERRLLTAPRHWSEIELQARWFSGDFGREFVTTDGVAVRIVQLGVWNREAGPDFAEAAVSFGNGEPQRGCIELDTDARDWERHGHATNPDYDGVVLHLFFERPAAAVFTRTAAHRLVPQVQLNLSALGDDPPTPTPIAQPGRCEAPLRSLPVEKVRSVLEAAAQFRLNRKAARLARLADAHGSDQALFQSLASALGYKSNQLPFTLLAQKLPIRLLLANKPDAAALLFGVSGFLPAADWSEFERETRGYLRELWQSWWSRRAEFERLTLDAKSWRLSGQRPANHPQRRIAALAQIVQHWPQVKRLPTAGVLAIRKFFGELHDEYWDHHFTLRSARSERPLALVGESRITEILTNVLLPLAVAKNAAAWETYRQLPAALSNRRVEVAAVRLFGGDPGKTELLKSAAIQQGLLQVYEDFCMQDDSDCARCLFPKQLGEWHA